jgi:hypothetical protein
LLCKKIGITLVNTEVGFKAEDLNRRKASVRRLPVVPEVVAVVLSASSFVGELVELRSTRKVS